jgi:hypothetical protein
LLFLSENGHQIPEDTNPADFFLETINIDFEVCGLTVATP